MKDYIEERAVEAGKYIIETKATIRKAAKTFGVSKSTIHMDIIARLPKLDPLMAAEVREILDFNKAIRTVRGGEATKMKYKRLKSYLS